MTEMACGTFKPCARPTKAHETVFITFLLIFAAAMPRAFGEGHPGALERLSQRVAVCVIPFENQRIRESSGLAPSRLSREVLWTINDSGHPPELFAVGLQEA